jgi:hypothetical protein
VSGVTGCFGRVVLVGATLVLAACSGGNASSEPSPSPKPEQLILAQYETFWTESMPAATRASAKSRQEVLAAVMTEPALSRAVQGFAALDKKHRVFYGKDVPLRQTVQVNGKQAVVRGCLDSSRGGLADRRTGRKLNRGVATNPVTVTFIQGSDGVWRVSKTEFAGTNRC